MQTQRLIISAAEIAENCFKDESERYKLKKKEVIF